MPLQNSTDEMEEEGVELQGDVEFTGGVQAIVDYDSRLTYEAKMTILHTLMVEIY